MPYGLYIHLPFCRSKCPYCNFKSITGREDIIDSYTDAAAFEIKHRSIGIFSGAPQTVYIGGGTPSLVPAHAIKKIIQNTSIDSICEFTVEANPESITGQWLDGILEAGANRISIGVQSLDDGILRNLGRLHNTKQAVSAVESSRKAGFTGISVDLMFGVPGQTMSLWKRTLEGILELQPEHISGYSLSVEEDTIFYRMKHDEGLDIPKPGKTADMYGVMNEMLENEGLLRYEISNFARPGHECKHNMRYWNFTPYLGIGSSAHTFDGNIRSWNEPDAVKYIKNCFGRNESITGNEVINTQKRAIETVMLSLRTVNGLDILEIEGLSSETLKALTNKLATFTESGFLITNNDGRVVLTDKGIVLADEIITDVVSAM